MALESQHKAIIALVEGFQDRELATELTNAEIAVEADQLAELTPGEYYWFELVGMRVVNAQGFSFGKVTEMMATGSNDVLVVEGEKKYLIPYLPGKFVLDVNKDQQVITVDWDPDF